MNSIEKQEEAVLLSASQVYKDIDVSLLPLNPCIIKQEVVGNITYVHFYIDGEEVADGISKIYCVCAYNASCEVLPAIVFVNELTKDIDYGRLNSWANLGYFAITFDNKGDTGEIVKLFSKYPPSISYANNEKAGRAKNFCDISAQKTSWFHWVINTRRVLTYLCQSPLVDAKNIGIYGVKDSANIVIQSAATDSRIKTAAVLYGDIWQKVDIDNDSIAKQVDNDNKLRETLLLNEERQRFLAGVCPQSFLPLITQPFYSCVGTNSYNTNMDMVFKAVSRMNNDGKSQVFMLARMMDVGAITDRNNLTRWFEDNLKKNSVTIHHPTVKVETVEGKLLASIDATGVGKIIKTEVFYSRSATLPCVRNWVLAKNLTDDKYILDTYSKTGEIYVYATLTLRNQSKVSCPCVCVHLENFDVNPLRKSNIFYNGKEGVGEFIPLMLGQEMGIEDVDRNPVASVTSLFAINGVSGTNMATFALTDNKYIFSNDRVINFDVFSDIEQTLTVSFVVGWGRINRVFSTQVALLGGNIWQKITLEIYEAKSEMGKSIKETDIIDMLHFSVDKPISVNNILFS